MQQGKTAQAQRIQALHTRNTMLLSGETRGASCNATFNGPDARRIVTLSWLGA